MSVSVTPRRPPARPLARAELSWIHVAPGAPYFVTDRGEAWAPIGQNDAITWPELAGLYRRRDLAGAEAHLRQLAATGVTGLRLMLEYCHREHRYLERPVGRFVPAIVRLWDDLFALCEQTGLRVLLTPFDTFFLWKRWAKHPYNRRNGGPCSAPSQLLLCGDTRSAMKARLAFAVERWGGSGALFAWDLLNEIHPAHAGDRAEPFDEFIADLSDHVRTLETHLYGRSHPQTVSMFWPEIVRRRSLDLAGPIFRHPSLDFASVHMYEPGTIDHPRNTVDAAVSTGRIVRQALAEIRDARPFFDSEHGPIHTFKDFHRTLPEPFDDEYFRHMQWAHVASGGVGGGMRWPNRHPHTLTPGMRAAQRSLSRFLPLVDWARFRRRNMNEEVRVTGGVRPVPFACGDGRQAVVWLLRTDAVRRDGMLRRDVPPARVCVVVPGLEAGRYGVTVWDTVAGAAPASWEVEHAGGPFGVELDVTADVAVAVAMR